MSGGLKCKCELFQKNSGGNWETVLCVPGYIGKNGCAETIDSKVEGDGKTPIGDFEVKSSFGICTESGNYNTISADYG